MLVLNLILILVLRDFIRRSSRSRRPSTTEIEKRVSKEFVGWFQRLILKPDTIDTMSADLQFLARGPLDKVRRFSAEYWTVEAIGHQIYCLGQCRILMCKYMKAWTERQRILNLSVSELNLANSAMKPKTGIEFPVVLDNLLDGEQDYSFNSEVNICFTILLSWIFLPF
ncbi:fatty-acid-binding protein [Trifolium repens]|nr:fatty-acid-binding protein [Trifolium repens]